MQKFEIKYVDVHSYADDGFPTARFDVLVSGSTKSGDGRKSPGILAATVYLPTGSDDDQARQQLASMLKGVAHDLETTPSGAGGLEAVVKAAE